MVALEYPSWHAEPTGELVQLVVRQVTYQVRPVVATPRPHGRVNEDRHRRSMPP